MRFVSQHYRFDLGRENLLKSGGKLIASATLLSAPLVAQVLLRGIVLDLYHRYVTTHCLSHSHAGKVQSHSVLPYLFWSAVLWYLVVLHCTAPPFGEWIRTPSHHSHSYYLYSKPPLYISVYVDSCLATDICYGIEWSSFGSSVG